MLFTIGAVHFLILISAAAPRHPGHHQRDQAGQAHVIEDEDQIPCQIEQPGPLPQPHRGIGQEQRPQREPEERQGRVEAGQLAQPLQGQAPQALWIYWSRTFFR